ncbi:MAG TPA: FliH/SctL family protein [Patescibacteria group bacterium]|jgi:flagellar assembly protein FliH|nr:FliH/SctL family protein [Patescibacteria group bacterium]
MKWSETITFAQPLREVALSADGGDENVEDLLRAREEAGYQRGKREVETLLNAQLAAERAQMAETQRGVLEALRGVIPQVVQESETALIALALESARRIVAGMPIDANMVEAVVREALRQAEDSAEILVQLHSEDLTLLRQTNSEILGGLPDKGPLRFMASSEVTRGGCLVQTRFGMIDARREVKLEQLSQSVSR